MRRLIVSELIAKLLLLNMDSEIFLEVEGEVYPALQVDPLFFGNSASNKGILISADSEVIQ